MTDSEPVLWRKGEKNPGRGVKRIWNCMLTISQSPFKGDGVPIEEWTGEFYYRARLRWRIGAVAKASLNRANSTMTKTRNPTIYPWAGWRWGKTYWRTEPTFVETPADDLWIGEKFQSSWEIAGSPRNSFRASVYDSFYGGRALNDRGTHLALPSSIKLRTPYIERKQSECGG